jgi:acetyl esterase
VLTADFMKFSSISAKPVFGSRHCAAVREPPARQISVARRCAPARPQACLRKPKEISVPPPGATWLARAGTRVFMEAFKLIEPLTRLGQAWAWGIQAEFVQDVEVVRDLAYAEHPAQRLDLWRVADTHPQAHRTGVPVVVCIHGGAFHALSKDSHWMFAPPLVRGGYMVANLNYRLGPQHTYPDALQDVCAATLWIHEHIQSFGGDPNRLVFLGDSAGANLAVSVALLCSIRRPEPFAQSLYAAQIEPRAVLAAFGAYQVTQQSGFWVANTLHSHYLHRAQVARTDVVLADPVAWLESQPQVTRPLPPFYLTTCRSDVTRYDSLALQRELNAVGAANELKEYTDGFHVFPMVWFLRLSQTYWRDTLAFLAPHCQD